MQLQQSLPGPLPSIEKKRRLPLNLDRASGEAARRRLRRLSGADFARRVRFRDKAGYRYALPHADDALYQHYLNRDLIDPLTRDNKLGARALLYVAKPRTRALVRMPLPGSYVRLLDLVTKHVVEVRLAAIFLHGRERSGHALVDSIVDLGQVVDMREFAAS